MSCKKWIFGTLILFILLIIAFVFMNYKIDFYGYFNTENQNKMKWNERITRQVKTKYVSENLDKYEGYILGGSKAGAINPDLISEYENMKFYNLCIARGSFEDYKNFTEYIANNTNAKKIILHLGNIELLDYSIAMPPATITGKKLDYIKEIGSYLFLNPVQMIKDLNADTNPVNLNGTINYSRYDKMIAENGAEEFAYKYVVPENNVYINWRTFNYKPTEFSAFSQNLEALRSIVDICNNSNIDLQVIIGPTFFYEMYQYEGEKFWEYLRGIASITDYWDFSGFYDINMNPYNFYDTGHYNYKLADKMINIIYGKEKNSNFGVYVNPNNFDDYIENRKQKFYEKEKEYNETETIKLFDMYDDSFIK